MQDCPAGSLAEFELPDLLKVSTVNDKCLKEARKEFKKKYGNEYGSVKISGPMYYDSEVIEPEEKEKMNSFSEAKLLVENFGDLIVSLSLNFEAIDFLKAKELAALINNKCSATLKHFHLKNCYSNLVFEINKPFKAVNVLEFSSNGTEALKAPTKAQRFDVLFPNTTALILRNTKLSDWPFVQSKFPKLEVFSINSPKTISKKDREATEKEIIKFIRVNRNIVSIQVEAANLKFLKDVSKYLPKLGRLVLDGLSKNYLNYDGNPIKFDNMQLFTFIMSAENQMPEQIDLQNIQILELVLANEFDNKWLKFVKKQVNKKLHSITLNAPSISNDTLLKVYEQYPGLVASMIQSVGSYYSSKDFEDFLSKGANLKTAQWIIRMKKKEIKKLESAVKATWEIKTAAVPQAQAKIPDLYVIVMQKLV